MGHVVSIGSGGPNEGSAAYFVGDFYGKSFEPTNDINLPIWLDYGRDNHTGVTWLDIPEEDGQKIFIGWMSDWQYAQIVPTKAWRSAMTIPRTLHLTKNKGAYTLASRPVEEIKNIDSEDVRQSYSFTVENNLSEPVSYQMIAKRKDVLSFEVLQKTEVEFDLKDIEGKTFGIELSNQVNDRYIFSIKDGLVQSERTCIGDQSFST